MSKFLRGLVVLVLSLALLTAGNVVLAQDPPPEEATEAPTEEATEAPTEEATEAPTEEATEAPTEEATEAPTEEATEAPTEEATEAPTEEATEAPTEEATEAPTEEATEAPTEEATEAPTEEATEAPTEEATEAPTEEATEAPTEEATPEPTEEATPVPTVEATPEPVAEPLAINAFTADPISLIDDGTVALTTTLSWDVTSAEGIFLSSENVAGPLLTDENVTELTELEVGVTDTTTYTLRAEQEGTDPVEAQVVVEVELPSVVIDEPASTAGEIGISAVVGTWTSQYVTVQNLGTSPATVGLQLYNSAGSPVGSLLAPSTNPVPVGGGAEIDMSSVANGQYSGVINASQPLASTVMSVNNAYKVGDLYTGISNPSQQQYVPIVYKSHFGWNTLLHVQNTDPSPQNITVKVFNVGQSVPSATVSYANVPQNASIPTINIATDPQYGGVASGDVNGFGYALIEGAIGNVAVVARHIRDDGVSETLETSFAALPASEAGRDFVAPVVFNNWFNWFTALTIVNLSSSTDTTITVDYTKNNGFNSYSRVLPSGAMETFWPNGAFDTSDQSFGSITVNSSAADVVVVVNSNKSPFQGIGQAVPGLNLDRATTQMAVPLMFNDGNWDSAVIAYAVDGGTFTAKWVPLGEDPATSTNTTTHNIPTGGFEVLWSTTVASVPGSGNIPRGKMGVLYVTGPGRIMGQANYNTPELAGGVMAAGIPALNY